MNITTKKTIAKEIIYFFAATTLFFVLWVGIVINNKIQENKINSFKSEVLGFQSQIDKNNKLLDRKLTKLDEYGIPIKFIPPSDGVIKKNSKNLSEEDLTSNKIQQLEKLKAISNQKLLEVKNKHLNENQIKDILFYSFIIIFGLLYPLRLIFILLKWSFRTLKKI